MVSWQTIQSLLLFLGPFLLPRALSFYRALRNRPPARIRPVPHATSYALAVLFVSASLALLSTLPLFSAENIFRVTSSGLHTPAGVVLTRLAALRPLTQRDHRLRALFDAGGLRARLLYARFGPHVLLSSPADDPQLLLARPAQALLFALPSLLAPHLLHLFLLGLATSPFFSSSAWRAPAATSALVLAALDLAFLLSASDANNASAIASRLPADFRHWRLRLFRGLSLAACDALLGWCIFLHASGRFSFPLPANPSLRLASHASALESFLARSRSLSVLRNACVRDVQSRSRSELYWAREGEVMRAAFEDQTVLDAQNNALRRIDTNRVAREADAFLDAVLGKQLNSSPAATADVAGAGG